MSTLSLKNINKIYPNNVQAVFDFNLEIADKEFIVFVGPSGCGKSTTLRMIAGLEEITSGELYIDNRLVNTVVPQERGVAMVFQNYALYPHMTVKDNISFALKHCKMEMPVLEPNEKYDEITEKIKNLFKQINAIDKKVSKTKKNKPDESLFTQRAEIYEKASALIKDREQYSKQIIGKDELRTKRVETTIKQLQKRIVFMEKDLLGTKDNVAKLEERLEKEKSEGKEIDHLEKKISSLKKQIVVLQEGIEERKVRLNTLNDDLDFLHNNDVPLVSKRKMKWFEILEEVYNAVEILDLNKYLYRKPAALSGGQRQRVALGRTIVRHPKVFLMDEPLSNLDAKLRVQTRSEISKIHKRVGATTVYVTHDQTEAMTMADRIVIMKDGYIQQIGTPSEVFSNPINVFVAGFIGNPPTNFIKAKYENDKLHFGNDCAISITDKDKETLKNYVDKEIILGVRPENIYLAKDESIKTKTESLKLKCEFIELLGFELAVYFKNNNDQIIMKIPSDNKVKPEDEVEICFDKNKLMFFDAETEQRIK